MTPKMNMPDYTYLFEKSQLTTDPVKQIQVRGVCQTLLANQVAYNSVQTATGVPWPVIGAIHFRESSQDFDCHLHNGDPLSARTVHVPAGRPLAGNPPFTWIASAIDALSETWRPFDWSIENALAFCEHYNGYGYWARGVNSPYVWSFTDAYTGGLFTSDGVIDLSRKDSRPGVAAIFKTLSSWGGLTLDFNQMAVSFMAVN